MFKLGAITGPVTLTLPSIIPPSRYNLFATFKSPLTVHVCAESNPPNIFCGYFDVKLRTSIVSTSINLILPPNLPYTFKLYISTLVQRLPIIVSAD